MSYAESLEEFHEGLSKAREQLYGKDEALKMRQRGLDMMKMWGKAAGMNMAELLEKEMREPRGIVYKVKEFERIYKELANDQVNPGDIVYLDEFGDGKELQRLNNTKKEKKGMIAKYVKNVMEPTVEGLRNNIDSVDNFRIADRSMAVKSINRLYEKLELLEKYLNIEKVTSPEKTYYRKKGEKK